MGLLDELKQQAALELQKHQEQEQVTQTGRNQKLQLAHAKLKDALHYWVDLFGSLNVITPAIVRQYYLEGGAIKLENLEQCNYSVNGRRVTLDHVEYIGAIQLRYNCIADGKVTVEKQMDPVVRRMREYLQMNNLKFDFKEFTNDYGYIERGIFTVNSDVPVAINILADLENMQVKIATKNLEKFGEYTYVFDLDEFGKDVLEELAKVIIAKPNVLSTMGRHQQAMRATMTRARQLGRDCDDAASSLPGTRKIG
jgi:hypothetical protein